MKEPIMTFHYAFEDDDGEIPSHAVLYETDAQCLYSEFGIFYHFLQFLQGAGFGGLEGKRLVLEDE